MKDYFRDPHQIVVAKMELADIGLELFKIRTAKIETVRDLLEKEEELDKQFIDKSRELQGLIEQLQK